MKSFFANYAWLIVSVAGGVLGIYVLFSICLWGGSPMSQYISKVLGGLM